MMLNEQVLEEIYDELDTADTGLIGCRRRGVWSRFEPTSYRHIRGNSILASVGCMETVVVPGVGAQDFYVWHANGLSVPYILQFRGGPWNLDWVEDFYDLWSIVSEQKTITRTIIVVHENRGEVDVKEVVVPDNVHALTRLKKMLEERSSDPPGRIPKSGERAARLCPHCPYKQRCDAEDILQGQTDDWSPSYPQP